MRPVANVRFGTKGGAVDLGGSIKSLPEVWQREIRTSEPSLDIRGPHTVSRSVERHITASGQHPRLVSRHLDAGSPQARRTASRKTRRRPSDERPVRAAKSAGGIPTATGQTCLRSCPFQSESRPRRLTRTPAADPAAVATETPPPNRALFSAGCLNRPDAKCRPLLSPPSPHANREEWLRLAHVRGLIIADHLSELRLGLLYVFRLLAFRFARDWRCRGERGFAGWEVSEGSADPLVAVDAFTAAVRDGAFRVRVACRFSID